MFNPRRNFIFFKMKAPLVGAWFLALFCFWLQPSTAMAQTIHVENADATTFALEKRVLPSGDLLPGQLITYTLRYTNTGDTLAAPLIITDTLPAQLFDVTFHATPPVTDTLALPRYVWQTGEISPSTGGVITVTGRITTGVTPPYTLQNQARLSSSHVSETASNIVVNNVRLPQLAFTPASIRVGEAAGSALITVKLAPVNPYTPVTVTVATQEGSAQAGFHYTAVTQTLAFSPGVTTRTLLVPVFDNDIDDGDLTVLLAMQNAVNGAAGAAATLTLVDDEQAGITLAGETLLVSEDGATDAFTVTLQSEPIAPVEITVTPENTAICQLVDSQITIAPADWRTPRFFTVLGVENDIVDGGRACTLVVSASSSDEKYTIRNVGTVDVIVADNDVAGIVTEVAEDAPSFTLYTTSQPTAPLLYTTTLNDPDVCRVKPARVTLLPEAWRAGITFTVAALAVDERERVACVVQVQVSSDDVSYDQVSVPSVTRNATPQAAALALSTSLGLAKDATPCLLLGENPARITVAPGSDVVFCFTVENQGRADLVRHTLTGDLLGTIFSGLEVELSTGMSYTHTLTRTVQVSESHTFTWTAEAAPAVGQVGMAQVVTVADTAQAVITVEDPTDLPATPQPAQGAPRLFLPSLVN